MTDTEARWARGVADRIREMTGGDQRRTYDLIDEIRRLATEKRGGGRLCAGAQTGRDGEGGA